MQRVKIGIIGLGMAWENLHAPAFARLSDRFEIVAVCDKNKQKAQEVAAWLNLPPQSAYSDYCQLLSHSDVEAVDVMVPIYENFECAAAVIKSGKHLLAEKPFASTPDAAKQLIKLKKKNGTHVLVAENYRYDEENTLIKSLMDEHRIGNPIYFIDNHVTEFQKEMLGDGFAKADWRKYPSFEGGVLLDSGVHHVARHRFLFGDVLNLYAHGRPSKVDFAPYSCINAMLTFRHHIVGHYSFNLLGKETQSPRIGLRIFGTNGEIYLEDRLSGFVNVSYKDGYHEAIPYTPQQGYYHELCNFYNALRHGEAIQSTPEKALGDIEVIFALLKSADYNEPVKVSKAKITNQKRIKAS